MTAIAGLWDPSQSHTVSLMKPAAASANAASGTSSSTSGSTISANDFLTLLVTEMQNQDPTAQTDPNEYINQLVQVNSLEQLIDINQNLSTALGSTSGSGASGQLAGRVAAAGSGNSASTSAGSLSIANAAAGANSALPSGWAPQSAQPQSAQPQSAQPGVPGTAVPAAVAGNLPVPDVSPAAQRIAQALSGNH